MKRLLLLLPMVVFLPFGSVESADPYVLQINMYGEQQVPPVETHAWGFVRFFFNEDRSEANYTVDIKGYSGNAVTGAAIHAGAFGENGLVVFNLADGGFIVTSGHLSLTPEELQLFVSGGWYVSLTTTVNPQGEMRGQIIAPAGFLPSGTRFVPVQPVAPAGTAVPGSISPPNTGDAGLR